MKKRESENERKLCLWGVISINLSEKWGREMKCRRREWIFIVHKPHICIFNYVPRFIGGRATCENLNLVFFWYNWKGESIKKMTNFKQLKKVCGEWWLMREWLMREESTFMNCCWSQVNCRDYIKLQFFNVFLNKLNCDKLLNALFNSKLGLYSRGLYRVVHI